MLGRSLPVVPAPADEVSPSPSVEDGAQSRRSCGRSATRHDTSVSANNPTRFWVTIRFDEEAFAQSRNLAPAPMKMLEASRELLEDIYIRRCCLCFTTFALRSDEKGGSDRVTEANFAKSRYVNFRTAFLNASFAMALGVLALAATAFFNGFWERLIMLGAGVAPLYLSFGLYTLWRKQGYMAMSGTRSEVVLIGLLCFQTVLIVCAEWVRTEFDYGMLVMHIGFIHNFTPLRAGAMQLVTAAFGLVPYSVLSVVRYVAPSLRLLGRKKDASTVTPEPEFSCAQTEGLQALLVRMSVPLVIFIYQVVVTMRRDESLRLDWISRLNLRMQQKLLAVEKQRNEGLLTSMLPRKVIETLKANEPVEPQLFEDVTVVFVEICNFHRLCAQLLPEHVVEVLNIVYLEFDRLSDLLHVYKVETVGQVYMAVVGCPEPMVNHADIAAHFALAAQRSMVHIRGRMRTVMKGIRSQSSTRADLQAPLEAHGQEQPAEALITGIPSMRSDPSELADIWVCDVNIRVGLNSGPIRAGIVGIDSPRYKLFGDTVNTASRMESTCEPGRVQVSRTTQQRLTRGMFQLEDRGEIEVKGKGTMHTAFLVDYSTPSDQDVRRVVIERGWGVASPRDNPQEAGPEPDVPEAEWQDLGEVLGQEFLGVEAQNAKEEAQTLTFSSGLGTLFEEELVRLCGGASYSTGGTRNRGQRPPPEGLRHSGSARNSDSSSALVTAALGREELSSEGGSGASKWRSRLSCLDRLNVLLLLVPESQKLPGRLTALRKDMPTYSRETHTDRVLFARNLTIIWLLLLAVLSGMDYFMVVVDEDLPTYRTAIIVRAVGNNITGLFYLLLVTLPTFGKMAQPLTIAVLALQGMALLAVGTTLYNSEPAIIALYGAYILFYTVCTVFQRLMLSSAAVTGYVFIEYARCGVGGVRDAAKNTAFLVVFMATMACSVRLQEYLQHVSHYEHRCAKGRLEEITLAKAAGSQLLNSLLPPHVVDRVGESISPIAEHHADVTIIFTDIKGFTAYSSKISAQKLVTVLNSMYSAFDEIISNWALYKVEIIGDAYFICAGCPPPPYVSEPDFSERRSGQEKDKEKDNDNVMDSSEYAMRAVEVGLALLRTLPSVCDDTTVQMRVGLHTGSVVAGVVGKKGPRYHLFGSTVAYAEKMESHGIPGRVQLSDATHALLEAGNHAYDFEERAIAVEGEEGQHRTWLVNRSNSKVAFQIQKKLMTQRRNQQWRADYARLCQPALGAAQPSSSLTRKEADGGGHERLSERSNIYKSRSSSVS